MPISTLLYATGKVQGTLKAVTKQHEKRMRNEKS